MQTVSRDTIIGIAINFPKAYQHIQWAARRMTFRECVRMALRHDREQKRQAREQAREQVSTQHVRELRSVRDVRAIPSHSPYARTYLLSY